MSVYSGFATRQQQTKYNSLIQTLIIALKKRIIKFYNDQKCDESKFKLLIKKIYKKLFIMEKSKYLAPKYTSCFGDLIQSLKIQINYDTLSETSSTISQSFTIRQQDNGSQQKKQYLKSKSLLQSKKQQIHFALKQSREKGYLDRFSIKKNINIDKNQNPSFSELNNNLVNQFEQNKINAKHKLKQLKQIKQLRSTSHMPKMEDFIPKSKQVIQQYKMEKGTIKNIVKQMKEYKKFRKQRFSKSQFQTQQLREFD